MGRTPAKVAAAGPVEDATAAIKKPKKLTAYQKQRRAVSQVRYEQRNPAFVMKHGRTWRYAHGILMTLAAENAGFRSGVTKLVQKGGKRAPRTETPATEAAAPAVGQKALRLSYQAVETLMAAAEDELTRVLREANEVAQSHGVITVGRNAMKWAQRFKAARDLKPLTDTLPPKDKRANKE